MMSKILEAVFLEAADLPEADQDALAAWIRAEIESDRIWSRAFAESPDVLAELAAEALAEHRAGKTLPLDPDEM